MKKEIIIAILIGSLIGFIVIFGIITAQKALNQQKQLTFPTPTPLSQKENQVTKPHSLTLSQPQNQSVITSEKTTLVGTTSPQSTVAITTPGENLITAADENGKFSQEITLTGGANIISLASFSPTGEKVQTEITLVYSTAEF